jgi:hypothetical protein
MSTVPEFCFKPRSMTWASSELDKLIMEISGYNAERKSERLDSLLEPVISTLLFNNLLAGPDN